MKDVMDFMETEMRVEEIREDLRKRPENSTEFCLRYNKEDGTIEIEIRGTGVDLTRLLYQASKKSSAICPIISMVGLLLEKDRQEFDDIVG